MSPRALAVSLALAVTAHAADQLLVEAESFKDHGGWAPRYAGTGTGETEIPADALARVLGVTRS